MAGRTYQYASSEVLDFPQRGLEIDGTVVGRKHRGVHAAARTVAQRS
jgi:hypothetical protein